MLGGMKQRFGLVAFTLVACFVGCFCSSDVFFDTDLNPTCPVPQPTTYDSLEEWLLHVRRSDYGWKEHTHRANIALAVSRNWTRPELELQMMGIQLEVEITKALMRNARQKLHSNDLALYIHSLVATGRNPRNFQGLDLVADLLHKVEIEKPVHPFLILALCNARAVQFNHLRKIQHLLAHRGNETREEMELKAIARKAFACAASLDSSLDKFHAGMEKAAECLVSKQQADGSFGNVYTTSLTVQALVTYRLVNARWDRGAAMQNLLKHTNQTKMNVVKAYYVLLALNVDRVKFLKDLHPDVKYEPEVPEVDRHYVLVSLRQDNTRLPYHTLTLSVPVNSTFFEIMEICSTYSSAYRFKYVMNSRNHPVVYSVSGVPDDAEAGMYWRICIENSITRLSSSHIGSPALLRPEKEDHIIYWYRNSECPGTSQGRLPIRLK